MKVIYKTTFVFTFLFCTVCLIGQNAAEKTLIKSFNLKSNDFVSVDLDGPVEIREWDNNLMQVQISVGIKTGSTAMLKSLVTAGRYNLQLNETDQGAILVSPNLERTITVRGNPLVENISYVIYKPAKISLEMDSSAEAELADSSADGLER